MERMDAQLTGATLVLMPMVPCVAPASADVQTLDQQLRVTARLVRHTRMTNLFDLPSITLPLPRGGLPVGSMLVAKRGDGGRLLAAARQVETALAQAM